MRAVEKEIGQDMQAEETECIQTASGMEPAWTLPGYLKRLRCSHGYRQTFVAAWLGIARQTYSHYETGRIMPPAGTLYRIAELYRISVEDLFRHMPDAFGQPGTAAMLPERAREKNCMESCMEEPGSLEWQDEKGQLLFYFQHLDERDRRDILSIMRVKIENRGKDKETGLL